MSLDLTNVIDKLKPIEKNQKEPESYFRTRENYEKKLLLFDYSIKSKLYDNKKNTRVEENLISQTSSLLKKLMLIDPSILSQISQKFNNIMEGQTQTEDEDESQINITKIRK